MRGPWGAGELGSAWGMLRCTGGSPSGGPCHVPRPDGGPSVTLEQGGGRARQAGQPEGLGAMVSAASEAVHVPNPRTVGSRRHSTAASWSLSAIPQNPEVALSFIPHTQGTRGAIAEHPPGQPAPYQVDPVSWVATEVQSIPGTLGTGLASSQPQALGSSSRILGTSLPFAQSALCCVRARV